MEADMILHSPTSKDLLTREEAAAILRMKPSTLASWVTRENVILPFVKYGGRVAYLRGDLDAFIERHRQIGSDEAGR